MRVLLVSVNYNSTEETLSFIKRCDESKYAGLYVVLLDNSTQPSAALARYANLNSDRRLYHAASENLGYLNGLGRGVTLGIERWGQFDWLVLCNVDLVVDVSALIERLGMHAVDASIGVVGPKILSTFSHRDQNPFLESRPSTRQVRAWRFLYRNRLLGALYELSSDLIRQRWVGGSAKDLRKLEVREVYAVHGSIFAVSGLFWAGAGEIYWPCFLFGEEIWFAEKARELQLKVVYDPFIVVQHLEHATTSKFSSVHKMRWHYESMNWLFHKHWRQP